MRRPGRAAAVILLAAAAALIAEEAAAPTAAGQGGAPALAGAALVASLPPIVIPSGASGAHDPTIIREGAKFYRFSTGRGISVAVSEDLVSWESAPSVFAEYPAWIREKLPLTADLWATDVVKVGGEFRAYYSASLFGSNRSAIGLATARTIDPESPEYGWTDRGPVVESDEVDDFNAIDANAVVDFEGGSWLAYGSFWSGIKLRRLDAAGRPADTVVYSIARRAPPGAVEGAFILPREGRYYLFVSFDSCCRSLRSDYHIRVGRADRIEGPYLDADGAPMTDGGGSLLVDGSARDVGPGHCSLFTEGGATLMAYHVYDRRYGGLAKLRIAKLDWDEDGWPIFPRSALPSYP